MYSKIENWRLLDSFYFCIIMLTTIGFGDFYPQTDYGKLFTIIYSILGFGIVSSLITGMFNAFKENLKSKKNN